MRFDDASQVIDGHLAESALHFVIPSRSELPEEFHIDDSFLDRCPRLLAAISYGSGCDTVDLDACTKRGVLVLNQAGGNREAVAEHTLGMMIALSKQIIQSDRALRRERGFARERFMGEDIYGKSIALIGLGNIGTRVAELCANAFTMKVLGVDPFLDEATITRRGAQPAALAEGLAEADFVSVHCPLNASSRRMFGAEEFAAMKRNAIFITTARGGVHDEHALADALRSGHLRGAGLDVWDDEPPPLDHPLLQLDNVVVSPHIAGVTRQGRLNVARGMIEQARAIVHGDIPPRVLNPDALTRFQERIQEMRT